MGWIVTMCHVIDMNMYMFLHIHECVNPIITQEHGLRCHHVTCRRHVNCQKMVHHITVFDMFRTHGFCTDSCNVHDNGFDLYHCHVHRHTHVCLYMCMLRPFVPSGQGKRHGLSSYHVTCHRHVYTRKMVC